MYFQAVRKISMSRKIVFASTILFLIASIFSCSKHRCDPVPETSSDPIPTIGGFTNVSRSGFPSLLGVDFQDDLNGYISGVDGFLHKTTDGGTTWKNISPTSAGDLYGLSFVSNSEGYIGSNNGDVFKTSNGGSNWVKVTTPSNTFGYGSFIFITQQTVFAAGGNPSAGSVLKTTDGGVTWKDIPIPGLRSVYDMVFLNQYIGLMCGYDNQIFKTSDGGVSWTRATINLNKPSPSPVLLAKIKFNNTGIGYCVGYAINYDANFILKSTDYGSTWNQISSPVKAHSTSDVFTSIFITSTNEVFITGGNVELNTETLFRSQDGGASWTKVPNNTTNRLYESCYVNNKSFVVGLNGTILKSYIK